VSPYILKGLVLPERAQISFGPFEAELQHLSSERKLRGKINIVLNQLTAWLYTDEDWDIFNLRNIVKSWGNDIISIFAFLVGHGYELEIRQILCEEKQIDHVFGIDNPYIKSRNEGVDIPAKVIEIIKKTSGESGLFLKRCLNDLAMALKHADDTAFYCFRALETLKQLCKYEYGIEQEREQWEKLSEITGFGKDHIEILRKEAFPARHGDISLSDSNKRQKLLEGTWDVVEAFVKMR